MNLCSCDECGIVLDKDKLNFPDEERFADKDGEFNSKKCVWNGSGFTAIVQCPVCQSDIEENE